MNTQTESQMWLVASATAMEELGAAMAHGCVAGACFGLVGDLGAGKTHWTKGFARALGYGGDVTSPTFGLVHTYHGGRLPLAHMDFYRTQHADEWLALGWDEYLEDGHVIVVEWANRYPELMPPTTRWLHFTVLPDGTRRVERLPG